MNFNSKKFLSFILSFVLIIGIFAIPVNANEDLVHITVLGTTDVHGNIYNWSYEDGSETDDTGLAKVYTVVQKVREENPNTILLDNGDTVQGTILTDDLYNEHLEKPNPMMDVMNFMGYDAMTLGNHEFNFGLDLIRKIENEAEFPILSANIYNKKDGSDFMKPYIIKEIAGVKVGIIGLTTPSIPKWDGPKVTELDFEAMDTAAEKHIKELKKESDIIIATAHAGLEQRHEDWPGDSAEEVIKKNPEIEVFLIGHDHAEVNEVVGNTLVGGAKDAAKQVVRFDLYLKRNGDTWEVVDKKADIISTKDYEASEELKEYAKEYHEATLEFIKREIGVATGDFHPAPEIKDIPEAQIRDTAVMDLINDVQLKYTGADVSAAALFKNESNIEEGIISYADVFDIYKYPNTLKVVEVSGEELKDYMEWSAAYYNTYKPGDVTISFDPKIRGYKYDMFQGVDYKIDISKPAGERIVDLKFKGEVVKPNDKLKLVVNDYRYSGLIAEGIISGEPIFDSDPVSARTFITRYIEEMETLEPKVDNNWEIIGADLEHPLRDYIIGEVNKGNIEIPKSEDGRSYNSKALNVFELIEEGKIPEEVLKKHGIEPIEKPVEKPVEKPTAPDNEEKVVRGYIVQPGDVLYRIALKHNTTWQKLASYNKLKNPNLIYPGQKILIP